MDRADFGEGVKTLWMLLRWVSEMKDDGWVTHGTPGVDEGPILFATEDDAQAYRVRMGWNEDGYPCVESDEIPVNDLTGPTFLLISDGVAWVHRVDEAGQDVYTPFRGDLLKPGKT